MDDDIERCALVLDAMVGELLTLKSTERPAQYDRQAPLRIDYAVRVVRRCAERVRALKTIAQDATFPQATDTIKLALARGIAMELRPVIARSVNSQWKHDMLRRLDELIGDQAGEQSQTP